MKNKWLTLVFSGIIFISPILFYSCTNSDTNEQSSIDKINEKNAETAIEYVQDPLDKAKKVKAESEQRVEEMEDLLDTE